MIHKKNWILLFGLSPLLYADLSVGQMEVMVEKIKAKREGSRIEKSAQFISPFVTIQKDKGKAVIEKTKQKDVDFSLGAIVNERAFVNRKWIKKGDIIEGYALDEFGANSITLTQEDRSVTVFLRKSKQILQIK